MRGQTQIIAAIVLLVPALAIAQNNRRTNQRQQTNQQQQQFTNRFNPDDSQSDNQQKSSFNSQQQQQQPRFNSNNNNNFQSEPRRESTTFIPILRYDNEHSVDGGYKTLWETGNNILAEETGVLKSFNDKDNAEAVVQQGSYSYTSPEGQVINVQYTADERGFRATGNHLPTPPPIPADIQKSLDLIYAGIRQQQQGSSGNNNNNNNQQYDNQQYDQQQNQNINFRPTGNRNAPNRG